MPTPEDKLAFSQRLGQALKRSSKRVETAAELALNFNLRHPSDPITPQAAQKWLTGQALPTIDKIATLAAWLNVSISWLGVGISEDLIKTKASGAAKKRSHPVEPPSAEELLLLQKIRSLSPHRKALLVDVLDQFALHDDGSQD